MCLAPTCKLMCSPTYYASMWLSDNLWLMSRQLKADSQKLVFSEFVQTDAPQYQTEIPKIISAYPNLGLSHLFFLFYIIFPGVSLAV